MKPWVGKEDPSLVPLVLAWETGILDLEHNLQLEWAKFKGTRERVSLK